MTYTAENLRNIIRDGKLRDYIDMERATLAALAGAQIVEDGDRPYEGTIRLGYMFGSWSVGVADNRLEATAESTYGDWQGGPWQFGRDESKAAIAYAKAALRNHLTATAARIRGEASARLASLEGAL